jgi:hypothetical protein
MPKFTNNTQAINDAKQVEHLLMLRNRYGITSRFSIPLSKPPLNEPQSRKHSNSPAMLEFYLSQLIQICPLSGR